MVAPTDKQVAPADERPGLSGDSAVVRTTPQATHHCGRFWHILVYLMTALLFATAGYVWGTHRTHPVPSKSAGEPQIPNPKAAPPPEKPTAVPTTSNIPTGVPAAPTAPTTEAEAALRAFLQAPDWQARAAFVVSAEQSRPVMRDYATAHGDGPISFASLSHLENAGTTTIFKLGTREFPEGFPVAVVDVGDGPKVDWDSFIGFHDDQFWKFVQGPADHSGIYYVLVQPDQTASGTAAANFASYRLSVPMPGRSLSVWIRRDSVGFARLRSVFAGSGGFEEAEVRRLDKTGVPLVLALAKRHTADDHTFVEIEDVVAVGWGPRVK